MPFPVNEVCNQLREMIETNTFDREIDHRLIEKCYHYRRCDILFYGEQTQRKDIYGIREGEESESIANELKEKLRYIQQYESGQRPKETNRQKKETS
jgi:hypothetical protein